jgi:heme-degrading monooxygenase HmoA
MFQAPSVARIWRGETTVENAGAYELHLKTNVFPALSGISGHLGAYILRRDAGAGVEFLIVTLWATLDSIRAFASDDLERAVIEPAALAVLAAHDDSVRHFDVSHAVTRAGPV